MQAFSDNAPSAQIEVVAATTEQQSVFANLIELYAHDFSEFHPIKLGADGRYGYQHLPQYWSEPDHYPFLIKVDGGLAGFALVKQVASRAVWDMAEFFIVRGYRRRAIGMQAAHEVWRKFPGTWQIRVMRANHTGVDFWQRATLVFSGDAIHPTATEKDGVEWLVFVFESKPDE